ncbi:MAG: prepilin-type N-terminal cleavage/methylation domain-containing protein [Phycisphaera sp.]|nr:prepilin-type N-terminal cleavage/methylation domain-containing protein [Phycisphaera sp.]
MSRKKAFTLIELLVVVSIIALLIAILLPSLNKARASSRMVVCQAIQHHMGIASAVYASEFRGYYVPQSIPHKPGYRVWYENRHFQRTMNINPPDGWQVYVAPRDLICPDAKWTLDHPGGAADKNNKYGVPTPDFENGLYRIGTTYGMNPIGLPSWTGHVNATSPENKYSIVRGIRGVDVKRPHDKMYMMDSMWADPTWGRRKWYVYTGEDWVPPAGNWSIAWRHITDQTLERGLCNVLHYDGHAEALTAGVSDEEQLNEYDRWDPTQ